MDLECSSRHSNALIRVRPDTTISHCPAPADSRTDSVNRQNPVNKTAPRVTRIRDQTTQRTVSPQRLLHYRENWYLLAWCHKADELRLFAVDAIRHAELLRQSSRSVAKKKLDQMMGSGFGIFGGKAKYRARLRFSPVAARWIADEIWHPEQEISWEDDHLILDLPYAQSRELAMEVLRHGPDVEVLSPEGLRTEISTLLQQTLARYQAD